MFMFYFVCTLYVYVSRSGDMSCLCSTVTYYNSLNLFSEKQTKANSLFFNIIYIFN